LFLLLMFFSRLPDERHLLFFLFFYVFITHVFFPPTWWTSSFIFFIFLCFYYSCFFSAYLMNVIHSTNFMTVILYSDYIRTLTFENVCSKKKNRPALHHLPQPQLLDVRNPTKKIQWALNVSVLQKKSYQPQLLDARHSQKSVCPYYITTDSHKMRTFQYITLSVCPNYINIESHKLRTLFCYRKSQNADFSEFLPTNRRSWIT
jgi:hypothetical protein